MEVLLLVLAVVAIVLFLNHGMQKNKRIVARFRAAAQAAMSTGDGTDGGPVAEEYKKLCAQYGRPYVDNTLKKLCHLDDSDIGTIRRNAGLSG